MGISSEAKKIIRSLESVDLYIQCLCYEEPVPLNEAGLFYLEVFTDKKETKRC